MQGVSFRSKVIYLSETLGANIFHTSNVYDLGEGKWSMYFIFRDTPRGSGLAPCNHLQYMSSKS